MNELTTLHAAITATLKLAMPELQFIAAFAVPDADTPLPALFHAITGMQPGADSGDGRSCILASFDARIVVDAEHGQAPLEAATLAARLTVLLRQQFWNLDFVEACINANARPVTDAASTAAAVQWRVQWQQPLYLGELQWPWPNQPPGTLAFAFSPDTGPAHKDAYQAPEDLE